MIAEVKRKPHQDDSARGERERPTNQLGFEALGWIDAAFPSDARDVRYWSRLCENSTRYKRTLNFEGCGQAESKKAIKFALRRAL